VYGSSSVSIHNTTYFIRVNHLLNGNHVVIDCFIKERRTMKLARHFPWIHPSPLASIDSRYSRPGSSMLSSPVPSRVRRRHGLPHWASLVRRPAGPRQASRACAMHRVLLPSVICVATLFLGPSRCVSTSVHVAQINC
jgi:hypothetical protein